MNALRLGAVVQGLLIWDLTGSVLSLGVIAAVVALPMMIVNVFGGVLSDGSKQEIFWVDPRLWEPRCW